MALNDYKITSTDEQGKLYTGMPRELADVFNTYQEVQEFMDSHGQLIKSKINALIDYLTATTGCTDLGVADVGNYFTATKLEALLQEIGAKMEQKADKINTFYTVTSQTALDDLINNITTNMAINESYNINVYVNFSEGTLTGGRYQISGTKMANGYEFQQAKTYNPNRTLILERCCNNGVWTAWSTQATTDKIDILITPASGMTKVYDNSYKINNVVFLNFGVKKTDDTAFATNAQVLIGTVPSGSTPITNPSSGSIQGLTSASAGTGIGNLSVLSTGHIYATMSTSNITTLRVSEVHICS